MSKVYKSLCVQRYMTLNIGVSPNTVLQIVSYFECCTVNASTLCSTPTLTTSYKRTELSLNSSLSAMLLHSFFTTSVTKQEARMTITSFVNSCSFYNNDLESLPFSAQRMVLTLHNICDTIHLFTTKYSGHSFLLVTASFSATLNNFSIDKHMVVVLLLLLLLLLLLPSA